MLSLVRKFMRWLIKQDKEREIRQRIMEYTRNVIVHERMLIFSTKTTSKEDYAIFNYLRRMQVIQQYQILYISEKEFRKVQRDPKQYKKYLKICAN